MDWLILVYCRSELSVAVRVERRSRAAPDHLSAGGDGLFEEGGNNSILIGLGEANRTG